MSAVGERGGYDANNQKQATIEDMVVMEIMVATCRVFLNFGGCYKQKSAVMVVVTAEW